jgi:hypothetical protein
MCSSVHVHSDHRVLSMTSDFRRAVWRRDFIVAAYLFPVYRAGTPHRRHAERAFLFRLFQRTLQAARAAVAAIYASRRLSVRDGRSIAGSPLAPSDGSRTGVPGTKVFR